MTSITNQSMDLAEYLSHRRINRVKLQNWFSLWCGFSLRHRQIDRKHYTSILFVFDFWIITDCQCLDSSVSICGHKHIAMCVSQVNSFILFFFAIWIVKIIACQCHRWTYVEMGKFFVRFAYIDIIITTNNSNDFSQSYMKTHTYDERMVITSANIKYYFLIDNYLKLKQTIL